MVGFTHCLSSGSLMLAGTAIAWRWKKLPISGTLLLAAAVHTHADTLLHVAETHPNHNSLHFLVVDFGYRGKGIVGGLHKY